MLVNVPRRFDSSRQAELVVLSPRQEDREPMVQEKTMETAQEKNR
jgi:hypothetical protein